MRENCGETFITKFHHNDDDVVEGRIVPIRMVTVERQIEEDREKNKHYFIFC